MYQNNFFNELVIDNFAGGGGASTGIELALGRPVDIAINHDPDAIEMHRRNHPYTRHYCENVWDIDPSELSGGKPIGLVWLSPDCKHFSKAKGGKPVEKKIRGLAWIALKWASLPNKPRVIILENVEEFQTWCRIDPETSKPDFRFKGETFKSFVNALRHCGYEVKWRELKACDYGAPTSRKRFFLVARCDGKPIVFPIATHGKAKGLKSYRTAAECIDWSLPIKSIFDREKPLADATMRRIARGIDKFVLKNAKPFIMQMNFDNAPQDIDKPLSTITTIGHHYIVEPQLAYLNQRYGGDSRNGASLDNPMPTVTATAHSQLVSLFMSKYFSGEQQSGNSIDEPLSTVTTIDHNALVAVNFIAQQYGTSTGQCVDTPLGTVTQVSKASLVSAFLVKYYGGESIMGQSVNEPLHTITTKDRFSLVVVKINNIDYVITDICMRMLEPHELFKAQGFPDDYIINFTRDNGKMYSKAAQVARCGNSVCPALAEALVRANLPELAAKNKITTCAELEKVMSATA